MLLLKKQQILKPHQKYNNKLVKRTFINHETMMENSKNIVVVFEK